MPENGPSGNAHCPRCRGLGDPAPPGKPDPKVVAFVEQWAKANGFTFKHEGKTARLRSAA